MNRFASFADPEEVAAAATTKVETKQKVQKETKKVVIKAKEAASTIPDEEFDRVGDKPAAARGGRGGARGGQRGGDRGGRGGARGGQRGGDREGQRGGDRGGRGRGRPRTAVAAGEGEDAAQVDRPKTGDKEKRFHKYTGKAREEDHPFDKKSGTGRGKRDQQKGGHGKGNWGNDKKPDASEVTPAEKPEEETKKEPEPEEEPVKYEEVGLSLDDFLAQKQASSKGLLKQAGGRTHEKTNTKGIEVGAEVKRITTIESQLSAAQTYAPSIEGAQYFGFSGKEEEVSGDDRRGGRGGRDNKDRQPRGRGAGGRKGGKLVIDDDSFPAL